MQHYQSWTGVPRVNTSNLLKQYEIMSTQNEANIQRRVLPYPDLKVRSVQCVGPYVFKLHVTLWDFFFHIIKRAANQTKVG